jgi:hypothetical protein
VLATFSPQQGFNITLERDSEVTSSHVPMLSKPDVVLDVIRKANNSHLSIARLHAELAKALAHFYHVQVEFYRYLVETSAPQHSRDHLRVVTSNRAFDVGSPVRSSWRTDLPPWPTDAARRGRRTDQSAGRPFLTHIVMPDNRTLGDARLISKH